MKPGGVDSRESAPLFFFLKLCSTDRWAFDLAGMKVTLLAGFLALLALLTADVVLTNRTGSHFQGDRSTARGYGGHIGARGDDGGKDVALRAKAGVLLQKMAELAAGK